ncbi:YjfB family protein [Derxia lacustris]|uniref:YjfB family protein n=1 Tax=Derxia lacustris TaxID=764842 RepID=UPI000A17222C|nr:YjfB family protein [Derxia lacustris]
MSISINASPSAAIAGASSGDSIGIAVLKKALDAQASSAGQLIGNLPAPALRAPVGSLGHSIDTHA